jgi:hypothetical protein
MVEVFQTAKIEDAGTIQCTPGSLARKMRNLSIPKPPRLKMRQSTDSVRLPVCLAGAGSLARKMRNLSISKTAKIEDAGTVQCTPAPSGSLARKMRNLQ